MKVEILSQGDEVLNGEVPDTNAAWLSAQLHEEGVELLRHTVVGDDLTSLSRALSEISKRADVCLCTGGLGPTCDDLTAEAVSHTFGAPLKIDAQALSDIKAWFHRSGRIMPEVNRKQALLPVGSIRIDNHWGTAPGFHFKANNCQFFFMPGVPKEMKAMFKTAVWPLLAPKLPEPSYNRIVFYTVGVGESMLQQQLKTLPFLEDIRLGFKTSGPENQVKIQLPIGLNLEPIVKKVSSAIGGHAIYSVTINGEGPKSLTEVIRTQLKTDQNSLFVMEGPGQGTLSLKCSSLPGFIGAHINHNAADTIQREASQNSDSFEESLKDYANRVRQEQSADYALIQQGEASKESPNQFLVHSIVSGPKGCFTETRSIRTTDRDRIREHSATLTLDFFRRVLAREP